MGSRLPRWFPQVLFLASLCKPAGSIAIQKIESIPSLYASVRGRDAANAPRGILKFIGDFMHTRATRDSLLAPAKKRWSRSRAQRICPRKHLRVLPTRTRPSLFGGD